MPELAAFLLGMASGLRPSSSAGCLLHLLVAGVCHLGALSQLVADALLAFAKVANLKGRRRVFR